jgi:rod shape-determining protein MreC
MRYIPQEEAVSPGDIVLTSGLGGNLPKRLIIGQIASVEHQDVMMFQEAKVIPSVNLRDLEVVMVLLNFTPIELATEDS